MLNSKIIVWIPLWAMLFSINLSAHEHQIELLKKELKGANNANTQVSLLINIGDLFLHYYPDSSLKYSNDALVLSKASDFKEGTANAHLLAGKAYNEKKQFENALTSLRSSEKIFQSINNSVGLGNCYIEKSYAFVRTTQTDSCTLYLDKSSQIFNSSENQIQQANIERIKGLNYWSLGKYGEGLISTNKAIDAYRQINDSLNLAKSLNLRGSIFWGLTRYENALKSFFESLYLKEKLHHSSNQIIIAYNNIGLVYNDWGHNEKAIDYFRKAEGLIPETTDKLGIAYTYLNLGSYQYKHGETGKALILLNRAKEGYEELQDINGICLCKIRIAQCHSYNENFELANSTFLDALEDARKSKNKHRIALTYFHLAKNEYAQDNIQLSLTHSLQSLEIADSSQYNDVQYLIYDQLSKTYEKLNKTTLALEMLKKAMYLKDAIYQEKIAVQFEIMELTRENEIKEFENSQLKSQNSLKEKTIRLQTIVVLIIILLFVAILVYNYSLSRKKKDLQKANLSKDKVFSIVSHDLRGPVGNLNNMIDLMVSEEVEEDYRELLNMFKPVITSSYNMLENLLVWAKSNLGKLEIRKENIQLHSIIKETIVPFYLIAKKKSISIEYKPTNGTMAFADPILIQSIIRNLLNNAIKFTNELGTIKIFVEVSKKQAIISVQDNGVGISVEYQKTLFVENKHTLGTNNETGSGIGLLLCKELAEKNGGNLWVESTEGKGSTFSFSIPVVT